MARADLDEIRYAVLKHLAENRLHADRLLHLLFEELRDRLTESGEGRRGRGLHGCADLLTGPAEVVEHHRALRALEANVLKVTCECIAGILHKDGMERAGDTKRDALAPAACADDLGCLRDRLLLTTDDDLSRAVQVAERNDFSGLELCLTADRLEVLGGYTEHRAHAAVDALGRSRHAGATEGHHVYGGLCVHHLCRLECRVLTEGKAGGHIRTDAMHAENLGHTTGEGHHRRLCVTGLVDDAIRILKDETVEIIVRIDALAACEFLTEVLTLRILLKRIADTVKHPAELRIITVQIGAHADMLAALSCV